MRDMPEQTVSVTEAARLLGVSRRTVSRRIAGPHAPITLRSSYSDSRRPITEEGVVEVAELDQSRADVSKAGYNKPYLSRAASVLEMAVMRELAELLFELIGRIYVKVRNRGSKAG